MPIKLNSSAKYLGAAVLLVACFTEAIAQQDLKLKFGTWSLNLEKSKFPPGAKPQSDTRRYEDGGNGIIKSTHTTINRDGKEALTTYAARFDGKEYPVVTRGSTAPSTIAFHAIDSYSESFVLTRNGKVAVRGTTSISKDGRTMTMILNTTNAQGEPEQAIDIYERQ